MSRGGIIGFLFELPEDRDERDRLFEDINSLNFKHNTQVCPINVNELDVDWINDQVRNYAEVAKQEMN